MTMTISELKLLIDKINDMYPHAEIAMLSIDGLTHAHIQPKIITVDAPVHEDGDGSIHNPGTMAIMYYSLCINNELDKKEHRN